MPRFDWTALASITGGKWSTPPGGQGVEEICYDSRFARPGALFCALPGDRVDGHDFVSTAARAGAVAALVAHPQDEPLPQLIVPDTLRAFQQLAAAHRRRQTDLLMIGITGSSGKTSTKEILASLLRAHLGGAVWMTRGNANTQIGVPETLLGLTGAHRFAVLELGTSQPGELARLTDLVRPDVAVLTSVGNAHLEGFGDRDGVAREKASIFVGLPADGLAVVPADLATHPIIGPQLPSGVATVACGGDATVSIEYLGGDLRSARFCATRARKTPLDVMWSLTGRHMALNAAAAIAGSPGPAGRDYPRGPPGLPVTRDADAGSRAPRGDLDRRRLQRQPRQREGADRLVARHPAAAGAAAAGPG